MFNQQKIIRSVLMWFGLILIIVMSIPYLKEYLFDAPEKELGTKEGVIFSIGVVLAVGSRYWNRIIESKIGKFIKNDKGHDKN